MEKNQIICRSGLIFGVVLGLVPIAHAQVKPDDIDRSTIRPGARALGMGGSYLIAVDDASAAVWNPAAIAQAKRVTLPLSLAARTDNIDVNKISNLVNGLRDLGDEVKNSSPLGAVARVQGAFNDVYGFARDAGATPGGAPAKLTASVVPLVGISFSNYGIVASSGDFADARIGVTGTTQGSRTINANAGGLALSAISIPFAHSFKTKTGMDIGTFGVSAKYMRADYAATNFLASEGINAQTQIPGDISGTTYNHANDNAFDIDLGYISPEFPKMYGARAAVAIRHVLSPKFSLNSRTNVNGNNVGDTRFDFRQRPQIDVGVAVPKVVPKTLFAAELHNISGVNGGNLTFHLGAEYKVNRQVAVRAGLDDNKIVGGLGFNFGPSRLDVAVGTKFQERFALGLSTVF